MNTAPNKSILFFLLVMLTCSLTSYAQSPQGISYQAMIRNADGNPVANSQVAMELSILSNDESGNIVYQEIQNPTTNQNGLISLVIGKGDVLIGQFDQIDWSTGRFFIRSKIDINGGNNYQLETNQQLLSVPYALFAESSGSSIPGPAGEDGQDGDDGVGIEGAINNNDGTFTLFFTNGTTFRTTDLTGPTGTFQQGSHFGQMLFWNGSSWITIEPGQRGQSLNYCDNGPQWGPCPSVADVSTNPIVNITGNSAITGGQYTGNNVTQVGVCYSSNSVPTINDNITIDSASSGAFISNLTGLDLNTVYFVRAYAVNDIGVAYGNLVSFRTISLPGLTVTVKNNNNDPNAINTLTVINSHGGSAISDKGICWSTSINPTIDGNSISEGTGNGAFNSTINGLTPNTTYFIRSYAINEAGLAYSNEVSFTTVEN